MINLKRYLLESGYQDTVQNHCTIENTDLPETWLSPLMTYSALNCNTFLVHSTKSMICNLVHPFSLTVCALYEKKKMKTHIDLSMGH